MVDSLDAMRFLLVLGLVFAPSCGDRCKDNEATCNGNTIYSCGPPDDFSNIRDFNDKGTDCGDATCIDVTYQGLRDAVCSTSGVADPRCAGIEDEICFDANTELTCGAGYSLERDCTGACIADTSGSYPKVFCSTETAPNPICVAAIGPICDNGTVATCFDGYVVDRIPCSSGCATSDAGTGYCTDAGTCPGSDQATCDDNFTALSGCVGGRSVAMTCNPGSYCENDFVITTGTTEAVCIPQDY